MNTTHDNNAHDAQTYENELFMCDFIDRTNHTIDAQTLQIVDECVTIHDIALYDDAYASIDDERNALLSRARERFDANNVAQSFTNAVNDAINDVIDIVARVIVPRLIDEQYTMNRCATDELHTITNALRDALRDDVTRFDVDAYDVTLHVKTHDNVTLQNVFARVRCIVDDCDVTSDVELFVNNDDYTINVELFND